MELFGMLSLWNTKLYDPFPDVSGQTLHYLDINLKDCVFSFFFFFIFSQQKPRKATPQPGEDTLNSHLPPGWQSYMSPQGRRYYVNTFTNGEWSRCVQQMCHPSSRHLLQGVISQVSFDSSYTQSVTEMNE